MNCVVFLVWFDSVVEFDSDGGGGGDDGLLDFPGKWGLDKESKFVPWGLFFLFLLVLYVSMGKSRKSHLVLNSQRFSCTECACFVGNWKNLGM